ncbi:reverse transcriptase domain-containing protein [Tanacetum coccineum]
MLKSLLSNKEKLLELENTPLNENCSAVILNKLPEKLRDPGKFLIPCGFSLPELISTRMTLKLANWAICTPVGIARDVFVPVGKFTFPADFVIVDYESDPRVPLILGRPFLRGSCFEKTITEASLRRHLKLEDNDGIATLPNTEIFEQLALMGSSDFLPSPRCDSVLYEDFSEVDGLPSTNNEDKVFNPGILIHENLFEITIQVTPDKNVKKLSSSNASLILEDFNPFLSTKMFPARLGYAEEDMSYYGMISPSNSLLLGGTSEKLHKVTDIPEKEKNEAKSSKIEKHGNALVFILPAGIIHDIEQLMCGFLWCKGEMQRGKAKVAWEDLCLLKLESGLGKKVKDVVVNGAWSWPSSWGNLYPVLNNLVAPLLCHAKADTLNRKRTYGVFVPFNVRDTWDTIRERGTERNTRVHGEVERKVEQLVNTIVDVVCLKLASIHFKKRVRVEKMRSTWKISDIPTDVG